MADIDPLVSVDWLAANLDRSDIQILDGTWSMPNDRNELPNGYIPGAQVFDIDRIADKSSNMKHMLPASDQFVKAVVAMGIENSDHVIVYDKHGVFSAPRVWWMFMKFGHHKVSVLDGGLPAWIKAGHKVENDTSAPDAPSAFRAKPRKAKVSNQDGVKKALGAEVQIVDARPKGRFFGTEKEPRAGLRSGRIPGSLSLPFGTLRTEDGHFKDLKEIKRASRAAGVYLDKPIITSCGSGITAAGLAFLFHRLGAKDVSVYDGSWTEWGASSAPIEGPDANRKADDE